nr:MAG TPA: hypothetical protein [Caudoviricetes sp.]
MEDVPGWSCEGVLIPKRKNIFLHSLKSCNAIKL